MFFKQTSITAPWPIPSSRDTHTYLLSAHMQAAWRPKSEVKYFVLQRAKLCGSCAGDSHDAQWPHMHTIICWFCHLKSGAATVPTPSRHIWSSLKSSSYSWISLCGGMCVCTFFGNYAGAAEIVDSYGWLRYANSTGCKSGKLLMHVAGSQAEAGSSKFSCHPTGTGQVISPGPYAYAVASILPLQFHWTAGATDYWLRNPESGIRNPNSRLRVQQ